MPPRRAPSYADKKKLLDSRLRKMEGQVRGIRTMLEEKRDCLDIVQQLEALSSGGREVAIILLETHLRALVDAATRTGSGESAVSELSQALRRIMKNKK